MTPFRIRNLPGAPALFGPALLELVIIALLTLSACAKTSADTDDATAEGVSATATAQVQVEILRPGVREEYLIAYGSIEYAGDAISTLSVPLETQVMALHVQAGASVAAGALLLDLAPSPNAALELQRTEAELKNARSEWQRMQRLKQSQLATNSEVNAAHLALSDAQARAAALHYARQLFAPESCVRGCVVAELIVKTGDVLAANGAILKLAHVSDLQVRFGVSAHAAMRIQPGQMLDISLLGEPSPEAVEPRFGPNAGPNIGATQWQTSVSQILQGLDPQTQLISVLAPIIVSAPQTNTLQANTPVKVRLHLNSNNAALSVPNAALLFEDQVTSAFVIVDGIAVKHVVTTGYADAARTTILSGLATGDAVVVAGANVLSAGMPVRVLPAVAVLAPTATAQ